MTSAGGQLRNILFNIGIALVFFLILNVFTGKRKKN